MSCGACQFLIVLVKKERKIMVTIWGQFITLYSFLKELFFNQGNNMFISPAVILTMRLYSSSINGKGAK